MNFFMIKKLVQKSSLFFCVFFVLGQPFILDGNDLKFMKTLYFQPHEKNRWVIKKIYPKGGDTFQLLLLNKEKTRLAIWDSEKNTALKYFNFSSSVACVDMSSDGKYLAVGFFKGLIKIFDISPEGKNKVYKSCRPDTLIGPEDIAFNQAGDQLFIVLPLVYAFIWKISEGNVLEKLIDNKSKKTLTPVCGMWSSDGNLFLGLGSLKKIVDYKCGNCSYITNLHANQIAVSPNKKLFATAAAYRSYSYLWNADKNHCAIKILRLQEPEKLSMQSQKRRIMAFNPEGTRLFVAFEDHYFFMYDVSKFSL